MKKQRRLQLFSIGVFLAFVPAAFLWAEDPPKEDTAAERGKALEKLVESSVDWYELLPDIDAKTTLNAQTVIRWRNVSRGQEGVAMMTFWLRDGRPEAMASIYPWEGKLIHEFGSLSREAKLVARNRDEDRIVWTPETPGVTFQEIPDAPAPGKTAAARLRQMKALAERFTSTMTGWKGDDSDREELRLLPRPLYRYELKDAAKETHPGLQDGAVFAFVQGTDPETVLLIEAVMQEGGARWQFACARATSGGLEAQLDGKLVWTAPKYPDNRTSTKPIISFNRVIELP